MYIMSVPMVILLLSVAVAEGQYDCVGSIPASVRKVDCSHRGLTAIPVLPAEVVKV